MDLREISEDVRIEQEKCRAIYENYPDSLGYGDNHLSALLVNDRAGPIFPEELHCQARTYDQRFRELDNKVYREAFATVRDKIHDPHNVWQEHFAQKLHLAKVIRLKLLSDDDIDKLVENENELVKTKYSKERGELFQLALGIYEKWMEYLQLQLDPH